MLRRHYGTLYPEPVKTAESLGEAVLLTPFFKEF